MPTTVNLMSWNIQNLGFSLLSVENPDKPDPADVQVPFIKLIAATITAWNADIVGLMELRGGTGASVGEWVCANLNAQATVNPGFTWMSSVSSKQNDARQEETLFIWKNQPGVIELNTTTLPGPMSLISMVDIQGFTNLSAQIGLTTPAEQLDLLATLANADNNILTNLSIPSSSSNMVYRINPNAWTTLNTQLKVGGTVSINVTNATTPQVKALTGAQLTFVAQALVAQDIFSFPIPKERTPYVGDFLIGGKPIRIALLHTPGPGTNARAASNIPALAAEPANNAAGSSNLASSTGGMLSAASAPNMIYMGDLNVSYIDINNGTTTSNYGRFIQSGQTKFGVLPSSSPNAGTTPVFDSLSDAPMLTTNVLDDVKTSLTTRWLDNNTATIDEVGANTYDNFYVRDSQTQATQIEMGDGSEIQYILAIVPATTMRNGTPNDPAYNLSLAKRIMKFYKFRKGDTKLINALVNAKAVDASAQAALQQAIANASTANINAASPAAGTGPNAIGRKRQLDQNNNQSKRKKVADAAANNLVAIPQIAAIISSGNFTPQGIGDALTYYRKAVSDHLPIILTLTA